MPQVGAVAVSRPVGFRFSCPFVRKVSRTACGQYPEMFRVGLLSASPPNGGPYSSFFSWFIRTFCWMRRSPLRARGVLPNRRRNSSSLIASHSRSEIVSGSNRGSKCGERCMGAFWLWGQQLWQRSQPKIHPSRSGRALSDSFSIVRQEMQRFVSITLGATMAPVGQLSRQFRQRPQRAPANGASYWSDGRVSTNSPSRT